MKLWILRLKSLSDYHLIDTYIIYATSAHRARKLAVFHCPCPDLNWLNKELTSCKQLKSVSKAGVVLAACNAG